MALLGLVLVPTKSAALSENDDLSCMKELPNPMSLAARNDYILTCTTKVAHLTVVKIVANKGKCDCQLYRSTNNMERETTFMSRCRKSGKPCDFTEVKFETNAGDFIFTWAPDEHEFTPRRR